MLQADAASAETPRLAVSSDAPISTILIVDLFISRTAKRCRLRRCSIVMDGLLSISISSPCSALVGVICSTRHRAVTLPAAQLVLGDDEQCHPVSAGINSTERYTATKVLEKHFPVPQLTGSECIPACAPVQNGCSTCPIAELRTPLAAYQIRALTLQATVSDLPWRRPPFMPSRCGGRCLPIIPSWASVCTRDQCRGVPNPVT